MRASITAAVTGFLLAAGLAATAQVRQDVSEQVQEDLDAAIGDYEKAVSAIEADVQSQLADLFDRYADDGELEKAQEVAKHRESFATGGLLADVPMLKTIREKARVRFTKANLDLRNAYRRAIAEFTRARDLRSAAETKRSFHEFEQGTQPDRLQFPRAAKEDKKKDSGKREQQNIGEVVVPESPQDAAKPVPVRGPSQSGGEGKADGQPAAKAPPSRSGGLAGLLGQGRERAMLVDRLATTKEKHDAVWSLMSRASKDYPMTELTYEDCLLLASISFDGYAGTGDTLWFANTPTLGSKGLGWSSSATSPIENVDRVGRIDGLSWRDHARSRFVILWLMASADPGEFVRRVEFLRQANELASVSLAFSEDDLKVWLAYVGCTNRERVSEVISRLQQAGVSLAAVSRFAEKEGL